MEKFLFFLLGTNTVAGVSAIALMDKTF
jgi:hypothetical protein